MSYYDEQMTDYEQSMTDYEQSIMSLSLSELSVMDAINYECLNGSLESTQRVINDHSNIKNVLLREAFSHAISHGELEIAKWIYSVNSEQTYNAADSLCNACARGHLNVAQWLYENNVIKQHKQYEHAFGWACAHGQLEVAQWLYSICPNMGMHFALFTDVCLRDHLEVAKWLYFIKPDVFNVYSNSYVFEMTCDRNQLPFAQWVYSICPGLINEVSYRGLFSDACYKGNLQMAQWLYSISSPQWVKKSTYAQMACTAKSYKKEHIANWLLEVSYS